jgi:hypothetical protein
MLEEYRAFDAPEAVKGSSLGATNNFDGRLDCVGDDLEEGERDGWFSPKEEPLGRPW